MTHLNELSKIYRESIAESAVPGKPAEKLGAVTGIPKADQMSAAERIKKKTAAKRAALEKKHGTKPGGMDDHPEYKKKEHVDEADMKGAPSIKDAKPAKKTNVKYDPHMKVMAPQKEALDPVGREDGDVDNDGDKDSSDKYLMKRRKAIGRAIGKKSR